MRHCWGSTSHGEGRNVDPNQTPSLQQPGTTRGTGSAENRTGFSLKTTEKTFNRATTPHANVQVLAGVHSG